MRSRCSRDTAATATGPLPAARTPALWVHTGPARWTASAAAVIAAAAAASCKAPAGAPPVATSFVADHNELSQYYTLCLKTVKQAWGWRSCIDAAIG